MSTCINWPWRSRQKTVAIAATVYLLNLGANVTIQQPAVSSNVGPHPKDIIAVRRPSVCFRFSRRPPLSLLSGIFCSKITSCHTALAPATRLHTTRTSTIQARGLTWRFYFGQAAPWAPPQNAPWQCLHAFLQGGPRCLLWKGRARITES